MRVTKEIPISCDVCGGTLSDKSHAAFREKPFTCKLCGKDLCPNCAWFIRYQTFLQNYEDKLPEDQWFGPICKEHLEPVLRELKTIQVLKKVTS
jgi:hypothetical protein